MRPCAVAARDLQRTSPLGELGTCGLALAGDGRGDSGGSGGSVRD